MLVGIYTRVSTQEQANEGYSLGEQEARLKAYCSAKEWTVAHTYTDGGFSGGNTKRPALQQLINDVKNKSIDLVLVYKLDRLSRSQKDTLNLIEDVFNKNDVAFVSMSENFDTSTPFGKAMVGILSVFAQLEREQIKERMQLGAVARAKEGYFHGGGYTPIGYDYIDGELVINDYEAMQVREIYELFIKGTPISRIRRTMASKYTNRYGNWYSDSSIRSCLETPLYYGKITYAGKVYDGRHKPIVTEDMFNRVQDIFKQRDIDNPKRKSAFARTQLLSGIIWCQNCGARYYTHHINARKSVYEKTGFKGWNYYSCYSRGKGAKNMIKDPNCKSKNWRVEEVDKVVIDEILKLQFDDSYMSSVVSNSLEDKTVVINERLEQLNKQLDKLMDLYQLGTLPLDKINDRVLLLNNERDTLVEEYQTIEKNKKRPLTEVKSLLENAKEIFESEDMEAKRVLVQSLIERIELGDDIKIYWAF